MRLEKGRRRGRGERVNRALKGGGEGRRREQWGRKREEKRRTNERKRKREERKRGRGRKER